MANENKMGYLPIKKLILQMSLPPMCSMFLQYSYNLVDSMFVANINENALAAVSLSFPITTLMISLSIWIGVGINVLIAGYLGEKEQDLADCATTLGLLVALIVGICINILALLISPNNAFSFIRSMAPPYEMVAINTWSAYGNEGMAVATALIHRPTGSTVSYCTTTIFPTADTSTSGFLRSSSSSAVRP